MKTFLAIIAGLVMIWAATSGLEYLLHLLYPPPASFMEAMQRMDMQAMAQIIDGFPTTQLVLQVFVYVLACFASVFTANMVNPASAKINMYVVGGLYLAATIWNMTAIPHPMWMVVATIIGEVAAALFAYRISARRAVVA